MHARAAGLPFTAYPSVPAWPSGVCQDEQIVVVFDHLRSRRTRDEITEVVERLRPDALVIDAMMEAAYDAAARSGLPTAVLCHFLASLFCGSWGAMVMGRPAAELLAGVDRVLALTRREFDDEGAHASVSYVGPVTLPDVDSSPRALAAAGLEALVEPGNPWVLASLSTTQQNQRQILPALVGSSPSFRRGCCSPSAEPWIRLRSQLRDRCSSAVSSPTRSSSRTSPSSCRTPG